MRRWLGIFAVLPSLALAEGHMPDAFPVLGQVVNVAADDVLNIRLDPSAQSEVIGTLAPNSDNIELVDKSADQRWGRVNTGEGSGWISLRYFDVPAQAPWHRFERPLRCTGTEPFWDFDIAAGAAATHFEAIDTDLRSYAVDWQSSIAARWVDSIAMGGGDLTEGFTALIENQICNDGMSDRTDALRLRLYLHRDGATSGFDGCCTLSP
ncbi:SH3 domain-containing protein [Cognatishimia sp. SS12]|uniref:SH3 domain-containing protein n=1 Tax=Cognatishimia sp. SS12 TaxID=2979465 RepID=UPI00232B56D5|nr:SH3 domain-containing protein [Cognatishimia sp. SS12]MDC0737682.1 SH3 domain-containing protein [Cognatishimia sp. SS12]